MSAPVISKGQDAAKVLRQRDKEATLSVSEGKYTLI